MSRSIRLLAVALVALGAPVLADTAQQVNGSDTFIAASSAMPDVQAPGDVFASGAAVNMTGHVAGDAHVAGFHLEINAEVAGDLYCAGAAVTLQAPVGGNLSMMGLSLRTSDAAVTKGNTRLFGGTIVIDGPIGGALTASGGEVTLNAPVTGDVLLAAGRVSFGPKAHLLGNLTYWAPAPVTIPTEVIAASRVTFHQTEDLGTRFDFLSQWRDLRTPEMPMMHVGPALRMMSFVTLGFLILLGAALLGLAPERVERLRLVAHQRPVLMGLMGVLGMATLIGLVPVAMMTVIALPLVPIVVLVILVIWTLGYLLGVYTLALRLFLALGGRESAGLGLRVVVLGCGLIVMALLNYVPVLGWIANFALMLFGVGGLSGRTLRSLAARIPPEPVAAAIPQPPEPVAPQPPDTGSPG